MEDIKGLTGRLDAEFAAVLGKMKDLQKEQVKAYEERKKRLAALAEVLDRVRDIWGPRLDLVVNRLGNHAKVAPKRAASRRERDIEFDSGVARIRLKFSASTDRDVRKLILEYDLEIIPVLLHFEPHYALELPLDQIDWGKIVSWIEDRIVEFVHIYLSMLENQNYLEDQIVEDPVAHIRFPKFTAAKTLEWSGKTWYFIGAETCRDFEEEHGIAVN